MGATVGKRVVEREEVNPDRYLFAKWMRRMMRRRGMSVSEMRDLIGVTNREFGAWIRDEPKPGTSWRSRKSRGRPAVPSDAYCKIIAELLEVPEGFVLRLADRARRYLDQKTMIVRQADGTRVRVPVEEV